VIGDIFYELKHIEKELISFLNSLSKNRVPVFFPPVDIFESEKELIIYLDVPGIKKQDLKVLFEGKHLIVEGTKNIDKSKEKGLNFLCLERKFGTFKRIILIGKIPDIERVKASLSNGVLKITVPFQNSELKPVEIKIKEEE